jgi:hypothetical protein
VAVDRGRCQRGAQVAGCPCPSRPPPHRPSSMLICNHAVGHFQLSMTAVQRRLIYPCPVRNAPGSGVSSVVHMGVLGTMCCKLRGSCLPLLLPERPWSQQKAQSREFKTAPLQLSVSV